MIFYRLSGATFYDKKNISFLIQFKNKRLTEILQAVRSLFMIVLILYMNLLNLFWIKKSIFEEYAAFNAQYIF